MKDRNAIEDLNLIDAYQNGNQQALAELIQKYYKYIFKVLLVYKGIPKTVAEDLTQDICYKLIGKLRGLKIEYSFKGFLDRMINNAVIDYYRKVSLINKIFIDWLDHENHNNPGIWDIVSTPEAQPDETNAYFELEKIITNCLSRIRHKKMQQLVNFWLNGLNGKPVKRKEMARLLKVSVGFVNGTLERGKALFRKCIETNYVNA
jgi:RNA polymerase sigma factor (sigma-70 family)